MKVVLRFFDILNSLKSSIRKRGFKGEISKPLCDEDTLGIHGYSHESMLLKSKIIIYEQLERSKNELEAITGEPMKFFRPASGLFNRAVLKEYQQLSLIL